MATVRAISEIPTPDAGVPAPRLKADEDSCSLTYQSSHGTGCETVTFDGCTAITFGYPNDEALPGHPLWSDGLRHYGVFEIDNSPWLAEIRDRNRVAFPDSEWGASIRHFIVTFHDSTFECLATGVSVEVS